MEALTSIDMARKQIVPAIIGYEKFLIEEANLKARYTKRLSSRLEDKLIVELAKLSDDFSKALDKLILDVEKFDKKATNLNKAKYCKDVLLADMTALRRAADQMELIVGKEYMPFPTYEDILYSVKY